MLGQIPEFITKMMIPHRFWYTFTGTVSVIEKSQRKTAIQRPRSKVKKLIEYRADPLLVR